MNPAQPQDLHPDTLAVRQALPRSVYGEHSEALYLTSSFVQPDAETAARRFAGEEDGYTYTRTSNPTVTSFEQRLAALEGTESAIGTASGMSAILLMCLGLLKAGDHVVCSQSMFGSTIKLIGGELARFGVESSFVPQTDSSAWKAALRPNTQLLFAETPTNPLTDLCDIAELAAIAHDAGVLLAVDNCFASPALQRPAMLGADLVIHSGTKFLDGQGRVMAGAVCGPRSIIDDKLAPLIRSAGVNLSPFNAWVVLKGMETLRIRMEAQSANALALAQWLEAQPQVARVYYPGLTSHPQHALAMRQQSGVGGAVLSFDVRANGPQEGRARAFHVIDSTRVCSITANLGDTKTTITHPASTSHGRLTEAQRQAAGIGQGLIRVAVGLEHIDDLKNDLARGLDTLS
ncbi:MAG TPA: O-succinylhomoserine sulfhydrylase [Giesbergeria sp.]|mgnify:FL=1|jgi:O-succinylhomoserine sulfhydrylase|uniref:O-succinylhomoserine sulfhydrylase n=1 Tax=Comamonadaceae TaxID=80864 RepID=UPI001389F8FD|nr:MULTISPECIES: O-succinylhomoserine sulfhydrylase [unclassified Acidovorax]MBL8364185.1 O-succinylhomoserine sulfhydrylase [Comamonas sp.]HNK06980.1 O-succinylhomoserine sulfhydrylase [Giesbergeria sp.]NCU66284.1 O-succinylhomoserine sulfhydrylase [Acidovorax sp. 210-6]HNM40335.1 O-succinylhomoserine sulfhydrylase [Giesbergeria sp.]HNN17080.1 O-succinylhomoserine sulfhydrylase [Giesbergeria sp.]